MSQDRWTITVSAEGLRSHLAQPLHQTLQHITLGLRAVPLCPDGPLELDEVFFSFHFKTPAASTPEAREEFKVWLVGVGLREGMEALNAHIDEVRFFLGLMKRARGDGLRAPRAGVVDAVLRDLRMEELRKFARLGFVEKASRLRSEFGISVPHFDEVLTIQKARNCLTHRRGIVGPDDLKAGSDALQVRFVVHEIIHEDLAGRSHVTERNTSVLAGESLSVCREPQEKTFGLGQRVTFTAQEFQHLIYTLWAAGALLTDELTNYAEVNSVLRRKPRESP